MHFRYELSLNNGYTFMMPFIGARARTWDRIIEFDGSHGVETGLASMVKLYNRRMNFSDDYTWDIDQHIVSHSILRSGLCTLPKASKLWKELNLEPK